MSEVLRAPWLIQAVMDDLSHDPAEESGLNHLHRTPKLVQIMQFMKSSSNSVHVLAHLSDKFHYIVCLFTENAIGNFSGSHPGWSLFDIQGAIIRILEYRFVKVPFSGDAEIGDSIVLVVEHFEHIGSDGSKTFGDPRYVQFNPAVKTSLQRPAPPSPAKDSQSQKHTVEYSFTQTLDPSDLLFLESTCTSTYQRQMHAFPQVITDDDWKISPLQAKLLDSIKLTELSDFNYGKSDVELSDDEIFPKSSLTMRSSPKRNKIRIIMEHQTQAQVKTSEFLTQTPQTLTQTTQYFGNSPEKVINEPVVFPVTQVESQSPSRTAQFSQSPSKNFQSPIKNIPSPGRNLQSSVVKAVIDGSADKIPSSPINSPIKSSTESFSQSPSKRKAAPQSFTEYPDYSSW